MKRQRFSEEQIIGVLREQEAGAKVADLCRKHGVSESTFYNWKAKYVRIPIEAGQVFRGEAGHRSDLKPAGIPISFRPPD